MVFQYIVFFVEFNTKYYFLNILMILLRKEQSRGFIVDLM